MTVLPGRGTCTLIAIIVMISLVSPGQPVATERLDAVLAAGAMAIGLALVAVLVLRIVSPDALKELAGQPRPAS